MPVPILIEAFESQARGTNLLGRDGYLLREIGDFEWVLITPESVDQVRQYIIRKMVHEARHREQALLACRAAGHDYAGSTIRHARLFRQECIEAVAANFGLKGAKKFRFFHAPSLIVFEAYSDVCPGLVTLLTHPRDMPQITFLGLEEEFVFRS